MINYFLVVIIPIIFISYCVGIVLFLLFYFICYIYNKISYWFWVLFSYLIGYIARKRKQDLKKLLEDENFYDEF